MRQENARTAIRDPRSETNIDIAIQYYRATRKVRDHVAHINRVLRNQNVRLESWVILLALEEGPMSQSGLRRSTGISKVAMSRALSDLCKCGFVNRRKLDHDRRSNVVELTEAGGRILIATKVSVLRLVEEFAAPEPLALT